MKWRQTDNGFLAIKLEVLERESMGARTFSELIDCRLIFYVAKSDQGKGQGPNGLRTSQGARCNAFINWKPIPSTRAWFNRAVAADRVFSAFSAF